jgi:hypothetical protein
MGRADDLVLSIRGMLNVISMAKSGHLPSVTLKTLRPAPLDKLRRKRRIVTFRKRRRLTIRLHGEVESRHNNITYFILLLDPIVDSGP